MADDKENVLVEYDYENIVCVDPNKLISSDGKITDRLVKHENLVMYANLEATLLPRTRLNVNNAGNLDARTVSIGKINFLQPTGKSFLTNQYTDDMVGGNVDNTVLQDEKKIVDDKNQKNYDSELLLINQISVESKYSIQTVTIEMEDVRGRALFEKGEESPYAAFFNYPTPCFYLTLKGYYGQAVKLQLAQQKFNARFNAQTGNFNITVNFVTYKYDILSHINFDYLYSLPFMYEKTYTISPATQANAQSASVSAGNSDKGNVIEKPTSLGRQKLHEVYYEYKRKKLIDENLPELTIQELATKIDTLETNLVNIFKSEDLKPLTDAENYNAALIQYEKEVYIFQSTSWFDKYMDTKNFFIDTKGRQIYTFKKEILEGQENSKRFTAQEELKNIISENNKILLSNETYGKKFESSVNISINTVQLKITNNDIDWEKTFFQRTGKTKEQNETDFTTFKNDNESIISRAAIIETKGSEILYFWYFFEGAASFTAAIENLKSQLKIENDRFQEELTKKLSSKIQEKEGGLGFKPLLQNFIAIVMANTEAFIRLMCDVHVKAWNVKEDKIRREVIFDSSRSIKSVDEKDSVETAQGNLVPIYPWPQYFVQSDSTDKDNYILSYIGDSRYINKTKGYLYDKWPEVEFVEEFYKGRVSYGNAKPSPGTLSNGEQISDRVSLNALDFPTSNILYSNRQITKFLYEIWERVYLYSNYSRFMKPGSERKISDLVSEVEFTNIFNSIDVDSPELLTILREPSFNSGNFPKSLQNFSIVSYPLFERDLFVTDYIKQEINNPFSIRESTILDPGVNYIMPKLSKIDNLKEYLEGRESNNFNFVDTFPFNNFDSWYGKNMASSSQTPLTDLYNTAKSLKVNEKFYMIANFEEKTLITENRPVTSFNYNQASQPKPSQIEIKNFYKERQTTFNTKQQPTEGNLIYNGYNGNLSFVQTTSMLNTPYFVNSILEGVENLKSGSTIPFISAGYLFINSLPLGTLKEKYKTDSGGGIDMDYIFATINKFGGIHKLPYSWILKYGSIWYRYKTWIQSGVDILKSSWKNFDRVENFDPIGRNQNKIYNLTINNAQTQVFLQSSTTVSNQTFSFMNVGFYPKIINNFHYLYYGEDLFTNYTDTEIQSYLNTNEGFNLSYGAPYQENLFTNPTNTTRIRTFSCLLNLENNQQFVVPSFGSNIYQINYECYNDLGTRILPLTSNDALYNGSVRSFWALPNFGYFDNSKVNIPNPDEYMKIILTDTPNNDNQEAFSIRSSGYSKMEEVFSVFNKKELDLMADEFLKFCRPRFALEMSEDFKKDSNLSKPFSIPKDTNQIYKNFHNFILTLFSVNKTNKTDFNEINAEIQEKQFNSMMSYIKGFMEYDIIMKNANPSDFDRRIFSSFSNTPPVEPFKTNGYLLNTLPSTTNTTFTLNDYINANKNIWDDLFLNVGFSTIDGISYTATGSAITDFFIDMNIEFSSENIEKLAPLIKIYATQKAKNKNYNKNNFTNDISNYLNDNKKFSDLVFNSLFNQLRSKLPIVQEKEKIDQPTAIEANQPKTVAYEHFKTINDEYIAGYDYTGINFMDDVLLLDRANRNISEFVYLDPFIIKNELPKLVPGDAKGRNVFNVLENIIMKHNFTVTKMTSYINYYFTNEIGTSEPNTLSVSEFGNSLFGTFMSVDTRFSSPKIICKSVSYPSKHLAMDKNENSRYNNDIFYLERTNNPLRQSLKDKNDYHKSNKVVAFNVDVGIRNQNIFYNFDVGQEASKETYESMQNIDYQVAGANGKKVSTANYSAWDFYINRSYTCTVRAMGNAMIQPSMYFNLRYIPMFYGPYEIMEVKHSITPGLFETTFMGIRASAYAHEVIDNMNEYLQLLTRQILKEIKVKTSQPQKVEGDVSKNKLTETVNDFKITNTQISENCRKLLPTRYEKFEPSDSVLTSTSVQQVVDNLKKYFPYGKGNDVRSRGKRRLAFYLMYLNCGSDDGFATANFNYCGLMTGLQTDVTKEAKLKPFGGNLQNFIEKKFTCAGNENGVVVPFAVFKSESKMYEFLIARFESFIWDIVDEPLENRYEDLVKNYYLLWNKEAKPYQEWAKFRDEKSSTFVYLMDQAEKSEELATAAGLYNY